MGAMDAEDEPRPSVWPGLIGGAVAGSAGILRRPLAEARLLAEIVVDASSDALTPGGFSFFLERFGADAKPMLFASVIFGELCYYALVWLIVSEKPRRFSHNSLAFTITSLG